MIIFKNLLVEDGEEDFCYGVLLKDESVYCLCGCDSLFGKGDYAIISANVDTGSNIPYQTILLRRKSWFFNRLRVNKNYLTEYGYSWEGMHGITARIGKLLFQYNVETYRLYEDNTEGVVESLAEFDTHSGWFGVEDKTLQTAIENGMLDDFFFEDWADDIRLRKKKLNTYVVCMNPEYVRDAQMLDTKEMTCKEFEELDWLSSELDDKWHDMEPIPFIGVVEAEDKELAIAIASRKYRYDDRCLYAAKEISHVSQNEDVYTLTVMGLLEGEFDLSTRVFDSYDCAQKEFYASIDYHKKHTWLSDYPIAPICEDDDSCDENRVLETLYFPEKFSMENITWEAYRDGYCSSMHTIIKLEKQTITKEMQNAK